MFFFGDSQIMKWGGSDVNFKVIYEEGLPNIWENARIFSHIQYKEAVGHLPLLLPSCLFFQNSVEYTPQKHIFHQIFVRHEYVRAILPFLKN
jgi:hypothetical protein